MEAFAERAGGVGPRLVELCGEQLEALAGELACVRDEYNTKRLHAGIGYVTPDDEHEGRGPQIRQARRIGLRRARRMRIAHNRAQRQEPT